MERVLKGMKFNFKIPAYTQNSYTPAMRNTVGKTSLHKHEHFILTSHIASIQHLRKYCGGPSQNR